MIKEDYVGFETAKLLKERGFDWACHATYDTAVTGGKPKFSEYEVLSYFPYGMKNTDDKYGMIISAPTLQLAMKWLRKEHNIGIFPSTYCLLKDREVTHPYGTCITNLVTYEIIVDDCLPAETYEEAIEKALIYCLKNLI